MRLFYQFIATALLLICLTDGCNNLDRSFGCSGAQCNDSLTVKISPTDNLLSGRYSAEIVFSDDVSIVAEFELTSLDDRSNEFVHIIENESYLISWFMSDEFVDCLEITYLGRILADDSAMDYEFSEELTIYITKDNELIFSDHIAPDYYYYWCNQEYGKCDPRQNKNDEIEVIID